MAYGFKRWVGDFFDEFVVVCIDENSDIISEARHDSPIR